MIIDVTLLLDFADDGAAAGLAGDQAQKGEVMFATLGLAGETPVRELLPISGQRVKLIPSLARTQLG
jgi:hypothetical protein